MIVTKNRWLQLQTIDDLLVEIRAEMFQSERKHGPFKSWHEAYAVILEELDELWESIKADDPDPEEALQVAACSARLLFDLAKYGQKRFAALAEEKT